MNIWEVPPSNGAEPAVIHLVIDDFDNERAARARGHVLAIFQLLLSTEERAMNTHVANVGEGETRNLRN